MKNRRLLVYGTVVVIVLVGFGLLVTRTNIVPVRTSPIGTEITGSLATSTTSLPYTQISQSYGLTLTPTSGIQGISQQQAISTVKNMFTNRPPTDVTLAYLDNSPSLNGTSVFVSPTSRAYQTGHGIVHNLPVWVVRVKGLDIPPHIPNFPGKNFVSTIPHNNTLYEFVDATNGDVLFAIAGRE